MGGSHVSFKKNTNSSSSIHAAWVKWCLWMRKRELMQIRAIHSMNWFRSEGVRMSWGTWRSLRFKQDHHAASLWIIVVKVGRTDYLKKNEISWCWWEEWRWRMSHIPSYNHNSSNPVFVSASAIGFFWIHLILMFLMMILISVIRIDKGL